MAQLSQIVSSLSQNCLYLQALRQAKVLYSINYQDLKGLSPYTVFQLLKKFNPNIGAQNNLELEPQCLCLNVGEEFWHPSEFKLFSWISVCYAYTTNKNIHDFDSNNIRFIADIFCKKSYIFIEYNLISLQKQSKVRKQQWSEEEKNLFLSIYKEEKFKDKWIDISFALYFRSDRRYLRSSHHCRELWFNHLNPNVNHAKWTPMEDIQLFRLAQQLGPKWAKISKALEGTRTQHMVKNRFNAITKKYQSRFQRASAKKCIQLIGLYLQKKYNEENQSQEALPSASNDSKSEEEEQNLQCLIQENEKVMSQEQCKDEKGVQTFYPIQEEKEEEAKETLTAVRGVSEYEVDFDNIKIEVAGGEGTIEEIEAMHRHRVQLIDLTDYDPEYKITIFSGTNS